MSKPEKIGTIIPQIFDQEHQWKYQLFKNWTSIFGPISDKLYLERINNDTLILAVYDACWMQELYNLSPLLLRTINKTFDKPYIKQLRFKRAGTRALTRSTRENHKEVRAPFVHILSSQEEKALASIKDPQLAQALRNFLLRCYQEQQLYGNNHKP